VYLRFRVQRRFGARIGLVGGIRPERMGYDSTVSCYAMPCPPIQNIHYTDLALPLPRSCDTCLEHGKPIYENFRNSVSDPQSKLRLCNGQTLRVSAAVY
jgi:hypothetical protein